MAPLLSYTFVLIIYERADTQPFAEDVKTRIGLLIAVNSSPAFQRDNQSHGAPAFVTRRWVLWNTNPIRPAHLSLRIHPDRVSRMSRCPAKRNTWYRRQQVLLIFEWGARLSAD